MLCNLFGHCAKDGSAGNKMMKVNSFSLAWHFQGACPVALLFELNGKRYEENQKPLSALLNLKHENESMKTDPFKAQKTSMRLQFGWHKSVSYLNLASSLFSLWRTEKAKLLSNQAKPFMSRMRFSYINEHVCICKYCKGKDTNV